MIAASRPSRFSSGTKRSAKTSATEDEPVRILGRGLPTFGTPRNSIRVSSGGSYSKSTLFLGRKTRLYGLMPVQSHPVRRRTSTSRTSLEPRRSASISKS
jgi:hypothetical protein